MSLGLFGAFLGGVLTLLSPCSVMLLPAFFSYAFSSPRQLLGRTGVFYLGLISTLVPLGVLAGSLGAFVQGHRGLLVTIAAVVVIVLGVVMMAGVSLPRFGGRSGGVGAGGGAGVGVRAGVGAAEGTGTLAVYALGTVYGLAGVCAGPILGAVLTYAAVSSNALFGGIILLVFAAGMVVPLVVLAALWSRMPFVRTIVRPRAVRLGRWTNTWTMLLGGFATVATGVLLLLSDGTAAFGGVLGSDQQFALEEWVLRVSREVPNWLVVLVAVAALVLVRVWLRSRRRGKPVLT